MKEKNYTKIIGFEISENSIVATELQFAKNSINITGGFRLSLPVFQNLNHTIDLIKKSLRASNIKTKDCAFGLSMQYFKLFPVSIPKTIPESEILSIVSQEGNVDLSSDALTYLSLNSTQRQDVDGVYRYDVLGMSISRSIVDISKFIAQKIGLKLVSLCPSFLGLGLYLESKGQNNLLSTLWISQIRSELAVWVGKEPIYEHLFLTHQISEQLNQAVNFLQSQLPGSQINNIFILGPYVKEVNLSQLPYNFQYISLPPSFLDAGQVFKNLTLPEGIQAISVALSASRYFPYTTPNFLLDNSSKYSLGSSTKKTDFSRFKQSSMIFSDPLVSKYVLPSILILLISAFAYFYISSVLVPTVQTDQSVFSSQVANSEARVKKLLADEKTNKILELKHEYFSELIDKRKPVSGILTEIGALTPKGLWIDRCEIAGNNLNIFGRALSVDSVANFSINLNYNSKYVKDAQIISMRKFQEEGIDIVEFQVTANLKFSPDLNPSDSNEKQANEKSL